MSFLDRFGPPIGKALTDATLGYTQGLLDVPRAQDEREELAQQRALRPLELEEKRLQVDEARRKAQRPPPIPSRYGHLVYDPASGTYVLHREEMTPKDSAQVQHERLMLEWLRSEDPQQQQIAQAWLSKMQAPGQQAKARADLVQPHIDHLKRQEEYWQRLAANAAQRNSAMAQHYRQQAEKSTAEIHTLTTVLHWLEHGMPEQQQAASDWLVRKRERPGRVGR
jgi:hypothetical protein